MGHENEVQALRAHVEHHALVEQDDLSGLPEIQTRRAHQPMMTGWTKPDFVSIGASVRLVSPQALCHEFGVTHDDMVHLLEVLKVPVLGLGYRRLVNLHALEVALFQATDPTTPLSAMQDVADLYRGARKAALLRHLREVGLRVFPDVRRRKYQRQRDAAIKAGKPSASSLRGVGPPDPGL